MSSLDKEINKLKNLKQNKDKTQEELEVIAKSNIDKNEILGSLTFCINDEEKKWAQTLLERYLEESSLESAAEKDTLRQLIDIEILIERVKKFLNTEYNKANPAIPTSMLDQITSLTNQAIELKDKLGLTKKEEQQTILDEWNKLKAKALAYYKESAGCNVAKCPYCQKLFMIMKDLRGHTLEKLPMFKKTLLYNKLMFSWYDKGTITKEQLAEALNVSIDYIDYIYENVFKNDREN